MLDFNKVKEAAQGYEKDMTAFLRAIVKNPGESCDEKAHITTIADEMGPATRSSHMMHILILSVSAISRTGTSTHMKVTRTRQRSADAACLTSAAVSYPPCTALRS